MPTNNVTTYLTYANLQMAGEAIYPIGFTQGAIPLDTLTTGNNRSSKFTPTLAAQFVLDWKVVAHKANTSTGFSGTLFQCLIDDPARGLIKDQLVMSLRSTEFIDDAARDNQATNVLEVKEFGWAFGQIDDMMQWFDQLNADPTKLQDKTFSVTGYSLGSNLATAFNLVMQDRGASEFGRIAATYSFNGAGAGELLVPGTKLKDVIQTFHDLRNLTNGLGGLFTDPAVSALYWQLRERLNTPGQRATTQDFADASALRSGLPGTTRNSELDVLVKAMERQNSILDEIQRLPSVHYGSDTSKDPLQVAAAEVAGTRLDYQLAVLKASTMTKAYPILLGVANTALDRAAMASPLIPRYVDLYGDTYPSAVAISQYRYGTRVPVFIEDQPMWRGDAVALIRAQFDQQLLLGGVTPLQLSALGVADAVRATYLASNDLKLLFNGFSTNDFGDTHSLALIVDSLSVQAALANLDPQVNTNTLSAILKGASNTRQQTGVGANNQGIAEGDVLERVVDALYRIFKTPSAADTDTTEQLKGGTWAEITAREAFHKKLDDVIKSQAFQDVQGKIYVDIKASSKDLASQAREDFGALVSLLALSPVSITAKDAAARAPLSSALGNAWGGGTDSVLALWQADKNLSQADRAAGKERFTNAFLADRANMVRWLVARNEQNVADNVISRSPLLDEMHFKDVTRGVEFDVGRVNQGVDKRLTLFGGDSTDTFDGKSLGDHLYGGAGNDTLNGQGGADCLEGNADDDNLGGGDGFDTLLGGAGADTLDGGTGQDLLLGGAGADSYRFSGHWGRDEIDDRDGSIQIDGNPLAQLKRVGAKVYQDSTRTVTATLMAGQDGQQDLIISFAQSTGHAEDQIKLRNWQPGNLGITPDEQVAEIPTEATANGDEGVNLLGWGYGTGTANSVTVFAQGGNDTVKGWVDGVGNLMLSPANYGAYSDVLDGGAGNDVILAGEGHDSLTGGLGDDYLQGGTREYEPGWWLAFGLDENNPQAFIEASFGPARRNADWNVMDGGDGNDLVEGGWGNDIASAGNDDDIVVGFAGDDSLFGDGGNDALLGDGGAKYLIDQAYYDAINTELGLPPAAVTTQYDQWYTPAYLHGRDFLSGGDGNDLLRGQGNDDVLLGGAGNDSLQGDSSFSATAFQRRVDVPFEIRGDDWLDGGAGDDSMVGDAGADTLYGGAGNDRLWGDDDQTFLPIAFHGEDYLDGEDGNDQLVGGGRDDIAYGGDGNDTLVGDDAVSRLIASEHGSDHLDGEAGDDRLLGQGGNDTLIGGAGADLLIGDDAESALAPEFHGDDYLDGGAGDDSLYGDSGADELIGGDGSDLLDGGSGADVLDGGADEDVLLGGAGNDTLISDGNDYVDGEAGDDTFVLSPGSTANVVIYLADTQGVNTLQTAGGWASIDSHHLFTQGGTAMLAVGDQVVLAIDPGVSLSNTLVQAADQTVSLQQLALTNDPNGRLRSRVHSTDGWVSTATVTVAQSLAGSGLADALDGGSGNDALEGGAGSDALGGGAGNDLLYGDAGADVLTGGIGNDTLAGGSSVGPGDASVDTYVFELGDGTDRIDAPQTAGDGIARDVISFGAGVTAQTLHFTRGQSDPASGYADLVISYSSQDSITLSPGAFSEIAEIRFTDGSRLGRSDVLRILEGDAGASGQHVQLSGVDRNDVLIGGALSDNLFGGDGDDVIVGGAGNDRLVGGFGTNTYIFGADSGADQIAPAGYFWSSYPDLASQLEQGVLQFTDNVLADLELAANGIDLLVAQSSGSVVRVRDYGLSPSLANWQVVDRNGAQSTLGALLTSEVPVAATTLADRRDRFVQTQLDELGTQSQRSIAIGGIFRSATPSAVSQVAQQVESGSTFAHQNYLNPSVLVQTTTTYNNQPVYESVTVGVPAQPARFVALASLGTGPLPPGATPVYGYGAPADPSDHGSPVTQSLIGYHFPAAEATTTTTSRLVGWQSAPVTDSTTFGDDVATQAIVTGTAGNDTIVPVASVNGLPTLFRGTIDTGAGDDAVSLSSGSNGQTAGVWSRFDEWISSSWYWQQPGGLYERGLGAWIDLGAGNDRVTGTDGNDFIIGGTGSDFMDGQAGADTYYVSTTVGDVDHISDLAYRVYKPETRREDFTNDGSAPGPDNEDTVEFDGGVALSDLTYRWTTTTIDTVGAPANTAQTLELFNAGQRFLDIDYLQGSLDDRNGNSTGVERFRFGNGQVLWLDNLTDSLALQNLSAPVLSSPIDTAGAITGQPFTIAAGSHFAELNGDRLTYTATLADGSPLPQFLTIDSQTGAISGLAVLVNVGTYELRVRSTNTAGLSVEALFELDVELANSVPVLNQPLAAPLDAPEGRDFTWQVPAGMFTDADAGDDLTLSMRSADGNALPAWLQFDSQTGTLSGIVPRGALISLQLSLTATDPHGASMSGPIGLNVVANPDDDVFVGTDGDDVYVAGDGYDLLTGAAGDDLLVGDAGNDTLEGGDGNDVLVGGAGTDTYVFAPGFGSDLVSDWDDALNELVLHGLAPTDMRVSRDEFSLYLLRNGTSDHIKLDQWYDNDARGFVVRFDDGTTWNADALEARIDPLHITNESDVLYAPTADNTIDALGGDDTIVSGSGNGVVDGNTGDDEIDGGTGLNILRGGQGDDYFWFARGTSVLEGDGGDDFVLIDEARQFVAGGTGSDYVYETNNNGTRNVVAFNLGDGTDFVEAQADSTDLGVLSLGGGTTLQDIALSIDLASGNLTVHVGATDSVTYVGWLVPGEPGSPVSRSLRVQLIQVGNVQMFDLAPVVADYLVAAQQNPALGRWPAQTSLLSNQLPLAADTAFGGAPAYAYATTGTTRGLAIADIRQYLGDVAFAAAAQSIYSTTLRGTDGADTLTGDSRDNRIFGEAGNDALDGGSGNDTMVGGTGDDSYVVDAAGDLVVENTDEGIDTVTSSIDLALGPNVEVLIIQTGAAATAGVGNDLNNTLTGNANDNQLSGMAGADSLYGGAGNDTMSGGVGADLLVGGIGNDIYVLDDALDQVVEVPGEGIDLVQSAADYVLGANVENLTLTGVSSLNGTGNALDNLLTGNSSANTLSGGAGNDTLDGGAGSDALAGGTGDDAYIVDAATDLVTEAANEGIDSVSSSVTYTLGDNVEILTLTGSSAINGTGNAQGNLLTGNSAANVLSGGAGNDTYVVGAGDTVIEATAGGVDTVVAALSWTLASNVENLALSGSNAIDGTGNAMTNVIVGNGAANTLNGGAGADMLIGGAGDDAYVVDVAGDLVIELPGDGTDLVQAGVSYTLLGNVENLTLTGTSALKGTGNTLDNVLTGNSAANTLTGLAGNDTLDGGLGNDTMVGGAGNDTYVVNVTTDVVTELANEGIDTVQSAVTWTLGTTLENLSLTGTSIINGTGNASNNVLIGNSAANVLTGNAGNDTLDGGAGADTLNGGAGADLYRFAAGKGIDTVQDNDATVGVKDRIDFGALLQSQVVFQRNVNNLEVSIVGNSLDKLIVKDWYLGTQYHVEEFAFGDGSVLSDTQVQGLVSAMASFSAPVMADTGSLLQTHVFNDRYTPLGVQAY